MVGNLVVSSVGLLEGLNPLRVLGAMRSIHLLPNIPLPALQRPELLQDPVSVDCQLLNWPHVLGCKNRRKHSEARVLRRVA